MIKYVPEDTTITYSEVPDEVSLCVNISNCQNRCVGCHSPYLRCDIGEVLDHDAIDRLIAENDGITCFCFMGEGNDHDALIDAVRYIVENHPDIMTAVYSGREAVENDYCAWFDYVKVGPYIEEYGPLNSRTTNQRMTMYNHSRHGGIGPSWFAMDVTHKFWK